MTWRAFPPRQITGEPSYRYGYVGRERVERHCHESLGGSRMIATSMRSGVHRTDAAALRCAKRTAARLNRSKP